MILSKLGNAECVFWFFSLLGLKKIYNKIDCCNPEAKKATFKTVSDFLANYCFPKKKSESAIISSLKERIKFLEINQDRTKGYLENIINTLPANIYWKDSNCVILGGNLSHAQQAGFSHPKDVIGKTDYDFVWKDAAKQLIENDMKIMRSGVGGQFEETGTLADGSTHVFLTNKIPMRDKDNNVIGIIGVSTDITEFKKLQTDLIQAQELAASALNEKAVAEAAVFVATARAAAEKEMRKTVMVLVGDIVHDLRTPITTIKAVAELWETMLPIFIDIIKEAKKLGSKKFNLLSDERWDYFLKNTPVDSIKDAVALIDDFISTTLTEIAKAHKAHATELTKEDLIRCSIRKIINNALDAYPFTDAERIKIHQDIACDFYLMGNSILIMKILFNLIKNALEQIDANGKGTISICTRKGKDYNLVIIKDTAGGASAEIVTHMFNDYFTTKKNGTGIGLAFCKRTMNSFGGDIVGHSIYGESMEFTLKFPTIKPSDTSTC